jgi:hypothetical protein
MLARFLLVLGAALALVTGVTTAAQAETTAILLRHTCTEVASPAAGIQGVACADLWLRSTDPYPYTGGEALCQRQSDGVLVECSGAKQTIELWNATKNKLVRRVVGTGCGSYTNYEYRCDDLGRRNYVVDYGGQVIGCDVAYVVVSATIRLPISGLYRTATVRTPNYRNSNCG